ncbi:uncharacterized protein LOC134260707 [Saccostrea cucullata]|uniref:uncharacterized protein LOC134260707 n=1 Tax=Saccostrea cuccullata TaxID=36930 RepID=UPI002ED0304A
MEMDSKHHIAFYRDQSLWQSYVNVVDGALQLNIKKWTGGQLKMDREEDKEEKFQSDGFDLTGHGETLDCAIDFDIQFRYSGTTKLEDPKVWEGSSEFRPWMVQMCVNNEDPSSLLLALEMEGMTFRELQVKGIWKLNVQLTITSKYAKRLLLMKSTAKGIKTGSAGEILGSEAVEKEKDDNQFSGLDTSFDPGTALGLKPSTAHDLSSGPAELNPFTGCLVSPDLEKKTLSCGPGGKSGVGRKFKKMSHAGMVDQFL